jgi:hypothetical protein
VKQSAVSQSWDSASATPARSARFSIAQKTGRWENAVWLAEPGRNADIFIFGWHPRTDEEADHRQTNQWQFYVMHERHLPPQSSVKLAGLEKLCQPVSINELPHAVEVLAGNQLKREDRGKPGYPSVATPP